LEELEVPGLQVVDDLPVLRRVDVDRDDADGAAKDGTRRLLLGGRNLLRGGAERAAGKRGENDRADSRTHPVHGSPPPSLAEDCPRASARQADAGAIRLAQDALYCRSHL